MLLWKNFLLLFLTTEAEWKSREKRWVGAAETLTWLLFIIASSTQSWFSCKVFPCLLQTSCRFLMSTCRLKSLLFRLLTSLSLSPPYAVRKTEASIINHQENAYFHSLNWLTETLNLLKICPSSLCCYYSFCVTFTYSPLSRCLSALYYSDNYLFN